MGISNVKKYYLQKKEQIKKDIAFNRFKKQLLKLDQKLRKIENRL